MERVRPKKQLGQHFLNDKRIAQRIVDSLNLSQERIVLEVGPGMGVLTGMLLEKYDERLFAAEVDSESVQYLQQQYPQLANRLLYTDFLTMDLNALGTGPMAIIGNFPYNISSQIFFKILDNRNSVTQIVGMVQREVAQRICEPPGSKTYGILSVFLQAYYHIEYLFTVSEGVFTPPPKVKSAVIRLTRNSVEKLNCDEQLFRRVVKAGFNQRRKTLRNSIRSSFGNIQEEHPLFDKRPEQLSVEEFVTLTNHIQKTLG